MIAKKICMIGAFSVGKTSLVERFVHSIFSDQYLSTVGVKISKKELEVDGTRLSLVLWDMEGKDDFAEFKLSYLRGTMGFFLVVDGARRETLDVALELRDAALELAPNAPYIILINKADLEAEWEISPVDMAELEAQGLTLLKTSAREDLNVAEAFEALARAMLERDKEGSK